jgi:predicted ATP-grasp superfamily ATP-dependent carboligase
MSSDIPWHYDQLRIADFYLLFFFRIQAVRLSPKHKAMKRLARDHSANRYERQPDDRLLFDRMEPIQKAAIGTLIDFDYFDAESFKSEFVLETERNEPEALSQRVDTINQRDTEIMQALQAIVTEYELLGTDGLKARTGLLEHRYDAV